MLEIKWNKITTILDLVKLWFQKFHQTHRRMLLLPAEICHSFLKVPTINTENELNETSRSSKMMYWRRWISEQSETRQKRLWTYKWIDRWLKRMRDWCSLRKIKSVSEEQRLARCRHITIKKMESRVNLMSTITKKNQRKLVVWPLIIYLLMKEILTTITTLIRTKKHTETEWMFKTKNHNRYIQINLFQEWKVCRWQ